MAEIIFTDLYIVDIFLPDPIYGHHSTLRNASKVQIALVTLKNHLKSVKADEYVRYIAYKFANDSIFPTYRLRKQIIDVQAQIVRAIPDKVLFARHLERYMCGITLAHIKGIP